MRYPFNGSYNITQHFGENPANYAQFGLKGHNGIDFGLPTGTEVVATHGGKVIEATSDPTGYGNYIKIEDDKQGSLYAHLQSFKVNVGDQVSEGQVIGISDNSGNSTGPHLHFGYYLFPRDRGNGYAGYIDPLPYLLNQEETVAVPKTKFEDMVTRLSDFERDNFPNVKAVHDAIDPLRQAVEDKDKEILKLQQQLSSNVTTATLEAIKKVVYDKWNIIPTSKYWYGTQLHKIKYIFEKGIN